MLAVHVNDKNRDLYIRHGITHCSLHPCITTAPIEMCLYVLVQRKTSKDTL